jgi:hypothetical protein
MDATEYAKAAAHHDLEIDLLRDIWLRGFTLEQRIRLNLQEEYLRPLIHTTNRRTARRASS